MASKGTTALIQAIKEAQDHARMDTMGNAIDSRTAPTDLPIAYAVASS